MNFLLEAQTGNPLAAFAPLIIIFVIFYVLFIMPQRKEQKKRQAMLQDLKVGDKVITNGGLYGVITDVKDESLILKIADNTKVEVGRFAIMQVIDKRSSQ